MRPTASNPRAGVFAPVVSKTSNGALVVRAVTCAAACVVVVVPQCARSNRSHRAGMP